MPQKELEEKMAKAKITNDTLDKVKNTLANAESLLNELYVSEVKLGKPEDYVDAKIEDLEYVRNGLQKLYDMLFGNKELDFNKHRVYRVLMDVIKRFDDTVL